ncbi:hypothetical protein P8452_73688 [Trifolium repens]|nr:hypothetical protein P8452_73688 [Trifolium repens]
MLKEDCRSSVQEPPVHCRMTAGPPPAPKNSQIAAVVRRSSTRCFLIFFHFCWNLTFKVWTRNWFYVFFMRMK